jgi:FMN reductase (NADPH)/FMN reductase [NAD(P)H]
MNPTIDLLLKRKSVRAYTDQAITPTEKETILQATLRAPTAGNMALYSILEVTDQGLKDQLAETCDHQLFIAKAPWVLLFLADYQRWYDYYLASGVEKLCQERDLAIRKPGEGDLLLACCDTLIAAHTAVIAAEALGIGSCYIGDILERYEIHRELLKLPKYVLPITMICFGYPTEGQAQRKQTPRFAQDTMIHQNQYHHLDAPELDAMMASRNDQFLASGTRLDGIENMGQYNYMRKFSAEFSYEMTRSVRAMLQKWCE